MKKGIKKNVVILFLITAIIVPTPIKADYVRDPDHVLIKGMLELYKTNNIVNIKFDNLIIVDTPKDEYTPFNLSLNRYGSTPKIVRNQKDPYNHSNYFVLDEINTTSYLFRYDNPNMDNLLKYVNNKIIKTMKKWIFSAVMLAMMGASATAQTTTSTLTPDRPLSSGELFQGMSKAIPNGRIVLPWRLLLKKRCI